MSKVLPILFKGDMVRDILDGRKTVTRRAVKFPVNSFTERIPTADDVRVNTYTIWSNEVVFSERNVTFEVKPPYRIGDILYIRETWTFIPCIGCSGDGWPLNCYDYQAVEYDDGDSISDGCFLYRADCKSPERITWRPSIHMPKQAARIWLKVRNLKVERLKDITEDQAIKEGISCVKYDVNTGKEESAALDWFPILWNSTVKKSDSDRYGWKANPWVWVIEFERCGKPEEET